MKPELEANNPNAPTGVLVQPVVSRLPACKGTNCGCTDGVSHSKECREEYDAATAMPYDEQWLHEPDDGRGWKCHACKYGGSANSWANVFCANCHRGR